MNSINNNTLNSYNYINNNLVSVQSNQNNTNNSSTAGENTSSAVDTVEISTTKANAFMNTLHEVSSETETMPCSNGYMTADVALFLTAQMMKDQGYTVPSFNNKSDCSNYSTFLNNVTDFLSNNSNISYSNNLMDYCNKLKERLNTYGIN